MKKIMFADRFGLTQAVIEGRKTQTRRNFTLTLHKKEVIGKGLIEVYPTKVYFEEGEWKFVYDDYAFLLPKINYPKYKIGEMVAVAQSMCDVYAEWDMIHSGKDTKSLMKKFGGSPCFNNKMFVRASEMPHQIRITNVRIQRLQDISDADCLREGITDMGIGGSLRYSFTKNVKQTNGDVIAFSNNFASAKEAFANLIDKVSGKGTWQNNPFVWVYDFELIK